MRKGQFLILGKGLLLLRNCFLGLCMFNNILKMKFILVLPRTCGKKTFKEPIFNRK